MQTKTLRNNILYIFVSLVISFFIWLNLSGQNTSTEEITIPLELVNVPSNLVLKSDIPASVSIQIQATPAQLRFLATKKPELKLDIRDAMPGQNVFPLNNDILNLPHGVSIRRMQPSALEFVAEETLTRTLPVEANLTGTPAAGYEIKGVDLEPGNIVVKGPKNIITGLNSISTQSIDIDKRNSNLSTVVSPTANGRVSDFIFSPPSIKALVRIEEKKLEKTFDKIPITISNIDDFKNNFIFKIEPTTAKVKINWPQSLEDGINKDEIKATVSVQIKNLSVGSQVRLESPIVLSVPQSAAVLSIEPVMATITAMPVNSIR